MSSAAAVIVCILGMLGRPAKTAPPIKFLDTPPAVVSANAEAFVERTSGTMYFITSTPVFRDAQRGDTQALKKLASIYVHEEWHLLHGGDEQGAYHAQLTTLVLLGVEPGTNLYTSVTRSMLHVIKKEKAAAKARAALVARSEPPR